MAPIGLLDRLRALYNGESRHKPPTMPLWSAVSLSICFTLLYVIPFYLSKTTRPSPTLSRDAPSVIRARIRAVSSACALSACVVFVVLTKSAHATTLEALHLLGCWPIYPLDLLRVILLCSILFAGPLFEAAIINRRLGAWLRGTYLSETLGSWIGWRNYVAGPVTEEIVFRSMIVPLHVLAKMSPTSMVFTTPLYFGIAHAHHFYEFTLTHPDFPMLPAVIRTLVQFAYTSLFGFFATFVFLRTGSVFPAIAAHSFCNWMGLPRLWGRVVPEDATPIAVQGMKKSDESQGAASNNSASPSSRSDKLSTVVTIIYYVLLVGGAIGFKKFLFPFTESQGAIAEFGAKKGK